MTHAPFPRIELSDRQASTICMTCGARYPGYVSRCVTCASDKILSTDALLGLLRASSSMYSETELRSLSLEALPGASGPEKIRAIRAGLEAEGYVYLLIDGDGNVLEPRAIEAAEGIVVATQDVDTILPWISAWEMDPLHADDYGQQWFASPVMLMAASEVEAAMARECLNEEGIPCFVKRMSPQFGINLGSAQVYVDESDETRAKSMLKMFEARESSPEDDEAEVQDREEL